MIKNQQGFSFVEVLWLYLFGGVATAFSGVSSSTGAILSGSLQGVD